jgi:Tol biopolymer transport system component/predicted Ser/Thr protein kinase
MELKPGDKLGDRYLLLSKLGEGGFGEVWKARDTELDRDVAVKVSKAEFTARFKQEARTIAAFNHPNICQIYDVGPNYIVMELIDGVPLKGPLPVEKSVAHAGFILDALDAAHRKGFTHRDLKPANVMVANKGAAIKLLDFGLAKQRVRELGPDDVTGAALTKEGNITGTLQYMSPEQLNGKDADARSDIFAFGCVLYEMLSGKKAFSGSTTASVIAAIMEREPEPLQTTPPLDRVIRTCLAKDPDERFQTARDLKRNLQWAMETSVVAAAPGKARLPWAVAAAAVLLAAALGVLYFRAGTTTAPEIRTDIVTPATNNPASLALSPDGRKIAYVALGDGAQRLWVRSLDSTSAQPLPGTEGAFDPFWSPDSRSLGFFANQNLKRIDLGGGQPQNLAAVANPVAVQGAWSEQGVILFATGAVGALSRVPASGGQVVAVTKLGKGQTGHRTPRFLPGGKQFLFTSNGTDPGLWLGSLDAGEPRRISAFAAGTESVGEYLAPGWLVRVRGNVLVAQRFDSSRGQLSGDPVTLAQGVGIDQTTQAGSFSVSPSGTIAWRTGGGGKRQLIWFNRSGQNAGALGAPDEANLRYPELSPDGKRVAITRGPAGATDLWIEEGTRNSRFTFGQGNNILTIWSPDGKRVVFASGRKGASDLYQKPADGSGREELLLESADTKRPDSWSPDGRFILYWSAQNNGDLIVLPVTGDRKPYAFLSTPFNEQNGVFSPDGKWVAYQSNESGRNEIYVRPFPGPGGQWQVSTGGGIMPRWRADGKELYYLAPDLKLMAAAVAVQGASLAPGTPEALFQTHVTVNANRQPYDVARDGRFLIVTELESASTEPIHLLQNWKPPAK